MSARGPGYINFAGELARPALNDASSLLFIVAMHMDAVGEEGADRHIWLWESGIRFIARALSDIDTEVGKFLHTEKHGAPAEEAP